MLYPDALTPGYHPMEYPLSIPVTLVTGVISHRLLFVAY